MCGIIGCILENEIAAPVLLECVKRLEYRGYDSVGIATSGSDLIIRKDSGKIDDFQENLILTDLLGQMGIAHVRWATHGLPTKENAHPHTDCKNRIAVVHNGIIENYKELRDMLINEGHIFKSETDTEVIPHLIEKYIDEGNDFESSTRLAVQNLRGSYALAAICLDEPDKLIGVRKESPLIVGKGENEFFIASDAPAILKHTDKVIYLEDNEMVILNKEGVTIKDKDGKEVQKEVITIEWTPDMAEKGGYDHFMIKEIYEQPQAVKNTLLEAPEIKKIVQKFPEFNKICFVACGTSYHATLIGKYLFENLVGIHTDVTLASEFEYTANTLDEHTLVIVITQSGETADTLKALRLVNHKSKSLAIVNVLGSTVTREADYVIYTRAGPEIGVAATKTYISQLTCIYLLAIFMGQKDDLLEKLQKIPEYMDNAIQKEDLIKKIAGKFKDAHDFFFIGRGFSYPTAMEGALKLKEITYIHGEGYAAGELKHGPLALIDVGVPVVVVAPPGKSHDKTVGNVEEVKARGASVIGLGSAKDDILRSEVDYLIDFEDEIDEIFSAIPYVIPLQLLSYYISILKGIDPDKPKNLAKCVTVE